MIVTTARGNELVRLGERQLDVRPEDVLLFSPVRNEETRLPDFLAYYRRLGVSRFFFIDNASTDGTVRLLTAQPDAAVYLTHASYARSDYGVDWLTALLDRHATGHWAVVVDADALLVYPGCETVPLRSQVARLDREGANAMLTVLVDMYREGPIREAEYQPGTPLIDAFPYFDSDSYTFRGRDPGSDLGLRARIPYRGGVRHRLFWRPGAEHSGQPPYLQNMPLVRWSSGVRYEPTIHTIRPVRLASTTGALLHFKLFADFAQRALEEVRRGEHWQDAAQYSVYAEALAANPDLDPMYEGSVRYRDSRQLADLGLIIDER